MSSRHRTTHISLCLRGRPACRFRLALLAGTTLVLGEAAALGAQDREPITFETGIEALTAVTVYVRDQEQALRWYGERLGFRVREDTRYASGERVLAVAPPDRESPLIYLRLTTPRDRPEFLGLVGNQSGWVFRTADLVESYRRLRDLDVRFTELPRETTEGWRATFVDLYGNQWVLQQADGG